MNRDPFVDLVDDAVRSVAAEERSRRRRRRSAARESVSWTTLLKGLVESRFPVTIGLGACGAHSGVLVSVGLDVLVLDAGDVLIIALTAVDCVSSDGAMTAESLRPVADRTLLEEVERRIAEGDPLSLCLRDGGRCSGRLVSVGEDVVAVRAGRTTTVVPVTAIATVRCRGDVQASSPIGSA